MKSTHSEPVSTAQSYLRRKLQCRKQWRQREWRVPETGDIETYHRTDWSERKKHYKSIIYPITAHAVLRKRPVIVYHVIHKNYYDVIQLTHSSQLISCFPDADPPRQHIHWPRFHTISTHCALQNPRSPTARLPVYPALGTHMYQRQ